MSNDTTTTSKKNAAAKGVLFTILIRALSFLLTQLTNRFVDPQTLGKAEVRLHLWCSTTVLFLGREGFRLALLRVAEDGYDDGDANEAKKDNDKNNDDDRLKQKQRRKTMVNNVAWLSVPTGLFLSVLALYMHLKTYKNQGIQDDESHANPTQMLWDYKLAGILYCLGAAMEIITEPYMISTLRTMDVALRAKAEGAASMAKSFSCMLMLHFLDGSRHHQHVGYPNKFITMFMLPGPVSAFGMAQCIYGVVAFCILYSGKRREVDWPRWVVLTSGTPTTSSVTSSVSKIASSFQRILQNNLDSSTLRLSILFTLQAILKHMLTEGDRIVLSAVAGSYNSGVYAMVSSYGGMATRLVFQPLEENGRLLFSNQHASIRSKIEQEEEANEDKNTSLNKSTAQSSGMLKRELEQTYCALTKLVLYIGFVISAFGSNYTSILLRILAGRKWGSNLVAANALSAFCIYMSILALNGMTEAFVYGVAASGKEVGSIALAHSVVGVVFYVAAPMLILCDADDCIVSGTVGLMTANGLCMLIRCFFSLHFAVSYFKETDWQLEGKQAIDLEAKNASSRGTRWFQSEKIILLKKMLPRFPVLFCFTASYWITRQSRLLLMNEAAASSTSSATQQTSLVVQQPDILSTETASHVLIGIGCIIVTGFVAFRSEKKDYQYLKAMVVMREKVD